MRAKFTIDHILEGLWLSCLLLIPLVFTSSSVLFWQYELPKIALLRVLGGAVIFFGILNLFMNSDTQLFSLRNNFKKLKSWVAANPARSVAVMGVLFFCAHLLSSITSLSGRLSVFGQLPDIDGYSLLNLLVYLSLSLAIALRLRQHSQLLRLLLTAELAGVLVATIGILELFRIIPMDWTYGGIRIWASIGNPIFLATFLNFTIIASALIAYDFIWRKGYTLLGFLLAVPIGVQILAYLATMSRGAWVGGLAGLVIFVILSLLVFPQKQKFLRVSIGLGMVTSVTAIIIFTSFNYITDYDYVSDKRDEVTNTGPGFVQALVLRAGTMPEEVSSLNLSSVSGRLEIWNGTSKLLYERPRPALHKDGLRWTRYFIGYGPDHYEWAYSWIAPRETYVSRAHNYFLHVAVELGLLGFLLLLGLLYVFFSVGFLQLNQGKDSLAVTYKWLLIGLISMLTSWTISSVTGVPKVSDMLLFWICIGLFVALPDVFNPVTPSKQIVRNRRGVSESSPATLLVARYALTGAALIVALAVIWTGISLLRSGISATDGIRAFQSNELHVAAEKLDTAINIHRDPEYYLFRASVLNRASKHAIDEQTRLDLAKENYSISAQALSLAPLSKLAALSFAGSVHQLAELGLSAKRMEAIESYERAVALQPGSWKAHNLLAESYMKGGLAQKALAAADSSLQLTVIPDRSGILIEFPESSKAFLIKALVYESLSDFKLARKSVQRSIDLEGLSKNDLAVALELKHRLNN